MSRKTYTLRYLHPSGSYRTLQLTGKGYYSGEREAVPSGEVYDMVTDSGREEDGRSAFRPVLVVSTSFLPEASLMEVADMAMSEDVTLMDWQGYNVKVIPSADDVLLQLLSLKPCSLKIRLRFAESDERYSPLPVSVMPGFRIHTDVFAAQFN